MEAACDERTHEFHEEDLREAPLFATCSECELSVTTLHQLLDHDTPEVCGECRTISYETKLRENPPAEVDGPEVVCPDCVP